MASRNIHNRIASARAETQKKRTLPTKTTSSSVKQTMVQPAVGAVVKAIKPGTKSARVGASIGNKSIPTKASTVKDALSMNPVKAIGTIVNAVNKTNQDKQQNEYKNKQVETQDNERAANRALQDEKVYTQADSTYTSNRAAVNAVTNKYTDEEYSQYVADGAALNPLRKAGAAPYGINEQNMLAVDALFGAGEIDLANRTVNTLTRIGNSMLPGQQATIDLAKRDEAVAQKQANDPVTGTYADQTQADAVGYGQVPLDPETGMPYADAATGEIADPYAEGNAAATRVEANQATQAAFAGETEKAERAKYDYAAKTDERTLTQKAVESEGYKADYTAQDAYDRFSEWNISKIKEGTPIVDINKTRMTAKNNLRALTDQEASVLLHYVDAKDWDSAKKYYESIYLNVSARGADLIRQAATDATAEGVKDASAKGVAMNIGGSFADVPVGLEVIGANLQQALTGEYVPVNMDSGAMAISDAADIGAIAATRNLTGTQKVLADAGLSIANNLATIAVANVAAPYIMGLEAQGQSSKSTLQNGGTKAQAAQMGIAAGLAETLAEKVPFDNLVTIFTKKSGVKGIKALVQAVSSQAPIEFSEESLTEVANILSEVAILKDKSQTMTYLNDYMTAHPDATKSEELWQLMQYVMKRVGYSGMLGVISGTGMGAGASVLGSESLKPNSSYYDQAAVEKQIADILAMQQDTQTQTTAQQNTQVIPGRATTQAEQNALAQAGNTAAEYSVKGGETSYIGQTDPVAAKSKVVVRDAKKLPTKKATANVAPAVSNKAENVVVNGSKEAPYLVTPAEGANIKNIAKLSDKMKKEVTQNKDNYYVDEYGNVAVDSNSVPIKMLSEAKAITTDTAPAKAKDNEQAIKTDEQGDNIKALEKKLKSARFMIETAKRQLSKNPSKENARELRVMVVQNEKTVRATEAALEAAMTASIKQRRTIPTKVTTTAVAVKTAPIVNKEKSNPIDKETPRLLTKKEARGIKGIKKASVARAEAANANKNVLTTDEYGVTHKTGQTKRLLLNAGKETAKADTEAHVVHPKADFHVTPNGTVSKGGDETLMLPAAKESRLPTKVSYTVKKAGHAANTEAVEIDEDTQTGLANLSKKIGVNIQIVSFKNDKVYASYDNATNTISINRAALASGKADHATLAHEITHSLEGTPAYAAIKKMVWKTSRMFGIADMNEEAKFHEAAAKAEGLSANGQNEAVAAFIADHMFTDMDQIQMATDTSPKGAKAFYRWLKGKAQGMTQPQSELERRQQNIVRKAAKLWRKAINQAPEVRAAKAAEITERAAKGEAVAAKVTTTVPNSTVSRIPPTTKGEYKSVREAVKAWERAVETEAEARTAQAAQNQLSPAEIRRLRAMGTQNGVHALGGIPDGEGNVVKIPVKTNAGTGEKVQKTYVSYTRMENAPENVTDEIGRMILAKEANYTIVGDAAATANAQGIIAKDGMEEGLDQWRMVVKGARAATKYDIALGEQLLVNMMDEENPNMVAIHQLMIEIANEGTRAGQVVQAIKMVKQMSPSWQIYSVEKALAKLNKELRAKFGTTSIDVTMDSDLAKAFITAKGDTARADALDAIYKDISKQVPNTLGDKLRAWRYLSMLGNPKTHIRNIVGNSVMFLMRKEKDMIGAGLEKAFMKGSKANKRTKTAFYHEGKQSEIRAQARIDYIKDRRGLASMGKYDVVDEIRARMKVWDSKFMAGAEALRKLNSALLEFEDSVFMRNAYMDSYMQFIIARGYSPDFLISGTQEGNRARDEVRQHASNEALKATFRDFNVLANKLSALERTSKVADILLGGLIPFKKTPMNIIRRGVEYSPVGLIGSLTIGIAQLKKDAASTEPRISEMAGAKFIDKISAGLAGTSVFALGMALASMGLIKASDDDDDKKATFDTDSGEQPYSIVIGGNSYTIDWLTPANMPLLVGVEFFNSVVSGKKDWKGSLSDLLDAATKVSDPVFQLSMLQGLNDAMSGYNKDSLGGNFGNMILTSAQSYAGQYIPTALGQLARTIDTKRRTTYAPADSAITKTGEQFVRKMMNKIPGLSQQNAAYVDMYGNEQTYDQASNWFYQFLSPGYYAKKKDTAVIEETERLFGATGEDSVLPSMPKGYMTVTIDGVATRYDMTAPEYATYKKTRGTLISSTIDTLIKSEQYKKAADVDRVALMNTAYDYALQKSKVEYLGSKGVTYEPEAWVSAASELAEAGLGTGEYIALRSQLSAIVNDPDPESEGETIEGTATTKKIAVIAAGKYSGEVSSLLYETLYDAKEVAAKVGKLKVSTEEYIAYKVAMDGITGKKDSDGETIDNTATASKIFALKKLDVSAQAKAKLYKDLFAADSIKSGLWEEARKISDYNTLVDYLSLAKNDFVMIENISREDLNAAKTVGIDTVQFLGYAKKLSSDAMKGDKDVNGKDIKGATKKDKTLAYLQTLGLTQAQLEFMYYDVCGYKRP